MHVVLVKVTTMMCYGGTPWLFWKGIDAKCVETVIALGVEHCV